MNYRPEDRPRLRPIDVFPFEWEGQEVFLLRDPLGYSEGTVLVPRVLGPLLAAMDGEHTLRDLQSLATRLLGRLVMLEEVEGLIKTLDQHYLLEGPRFEELKARVQADFLASPVRPPSHAGKSYPKEPEKLRSFLEEVLAYWPKREAHHPRALIAPHIDLTSGARAFAAAYRGLSWPREARVVILGTGHFLESPFSVLAKDFETPLGRVSCDREWISKLEERAGELAGDVWAHKNEHSIEFQIIFLQHLLGNDFRLVPILVASPQPNQKDLLDTLARAISSLADEKTYFVAGVDFCHLGLRYGDPKPAGEKEKKEALLFDHQLLQHILALDAEKFFQVLSREEEKYKVCGFGPLYLLLRILSGRNLAGKILHQEVVDFGPGSIVSFAAAALYES
ncbi:MAG: AmmeMemoRadiSam system protein B [Thermodesulfobacteria bacterium]|nr:AmmeMemoRadiSam system protein B [Thermodesulfobacteriota bacterium]